MTRGNFLKTISIIVAAPVGLVTALMESKSPVILPVDRERVLGPAWSEFMEAVDPYPPIALRNIDWYLTEHYQRLQESKPYHDKFLKEQKKQIEGVWKSRKK